MNELVRRNRERLQALSPRQIWIEATVNVIMVGIVSFYFSRSFWHALETVAFSIVLNLLWMYWLRKDQNHGSKRAARRQKRREVRASRE